MKPVVLVGHDPVETFGVAPTALRAAGAELELIEHRAGTGDVLPNLDDVSGIVLFGGEMNADQIDHYPFLLDERALVREAFDRGVPYLGICLGAQILARALDRPVYLADVREIGFNALHPTAEAPNDLLMSAFRDEDMVFHWHEDTFDLPDGGVLLGAGDDVRNQAFRVGDRTWGVQFHFEADRAEVELWLSEVDDTYLDKWGKSRGQILDESDRFLSGQEERAVEVFRRFAEVVRTVA